MDSNETTPLNKLDAPLPHSHAWLIIGAVAAGVILISLIVLMRSEPAIEEQPTPPDPRLEAARLEYERVTNERGTVTEDDIAQSEASLEQAVESRGDFTEEAREASRLEYERMMEAQAR